jgi:8-oxo-dGTP diphosphatase
VSVAATVVYHDGRLLAIRRRDNGHWEPPGDVLELEETIEDGVAREVREETGLTVRPERADRGVQKHGARRPGARVSVFCRGKKADLDCRGRRGQWFTAAEVRDKLNEAYAVRFLDGLLDGPATVRTHDGVRLVR